MKKRIDLDSVLADASAKERFDDGNGSRVWENAAARRKQAGRTKLRWLIPAAAAFTVLVTLCAVPQARAAMAGLFGSAFDVLYYLNIDKSARPENTAVAELVQSGITEKVTVEQEMRNDDTDWVKGVDVRIDEVLYDGQSVYVKYTIFGEGIEGFIDHPEPTAENPTVRYRECEPIKLVLPVDSFVPSVPSEGWGGGIMPQKVEDGVWKAVSQFGYSNAKLTGIVHAKLLLELNNVTTSINEYGSSPAGRVTAEFSFDANAGNASVRSIDLPPVKHFLHGNAIATERYYDLRAKDYRLVSREISVEGSTLEVVSATLSPVEMRMKIRFVPSSVLVKAHLIDDFYSMVHIQLMDGDNVIGWVTGGGSDGYSYVFNLVAPLIPTDTEHLTVRATFNYYTEYDGQKLEIGKPAAYQFGGKHTFQQAECEIDGGTFDIDLTK